MLLRHVNFVWNQLLRRKKIGFLGNDVSSDIRICYLKLLGFQNRSFELLLLWIKEKDENWNKIWLWKGKSKKKFFLVNKIYLKVENVFIIKGKTKKIMLLQFSNIEINKGNNSIMIIFKWHIFCYWAFDDEDR